MSVFSGDFLGFQLGDVHSSQLNITRVSTGDRYSDSLIPNLTDTTAVVPGADGTYYWKTFYTQRPFTIDFAFDDLRDEDIRRLRQVFGFKGVKELIFDEYLYKKYMVKCSAPPTLKYIAFDGKDVRIYKGEGSVNLVAYYPYAISTDETVFKNTSITSGEMTQSLSNQGDLDLPFKIYFPINGLGNLELVLKQKEEQIGILNLENISRLGTDSYISIDSRTNLIEGLNSNFKKTGNLYNRYITSGDFFRLPLGVSKLTTSVPWVQLRFNTLYY